MTRRGQGALLAALLVAGCGGKAERRPGTGDDGGSSATAEAGPGEPDPNDLASRFPLVTAAEIDAALHRVQALAEGNRTRSCPRPPLRGRALPGSADDDVLALIDRSGALAPCYRAVVAHPGLAAELSDRATGAARPLDGLVSALTAEVVSSCGAVVGALERAVGHGDACGVFLPGRRASNDLPGVALLSNAVIARARMLARAGAPLAAARVLLDLVRLGQDLVRGGGGMVEEVLATRLAEWVLPQLVVILESPGMDAGGLARLSGEVDGLLASEIDAASRGRAIYGGLGIEGLAPLLGPPGAAEDRQGAVLALLGAERLAADWEAGCPPGTAPRTCARRFDERVPVIEAGRIDRPGAAQRAHDQLLAAALAELARSGTADLEAIRLRLLELAVRTTEAAAVTALQHDVEALLRRRAALESMASAVRARLGRRRPR